MGLSCTCPGDYEDSDWYYTYPGDFSILQTKRGRRCKSCNEIIKVGSLCVKFSRFRYAKHEVEVVIYGEGSEIAMAPWYYCERCGEICLNLEALGHCIDIESGNMEELLAEYREEHPGNGLYQKEDQCQPN